MCVCVCACVCVNLHTLCICVCVIKCQCACMYVSMHVWMNKRTHAYKDKDAWVMLPAPQFQHLCIRVYVSVYVYVYVLTCTHTCMHACTHACMHMCRVNTSQHMRTTALPPAHVSMCVCLFVPVSVHARTCIYKFWMHTCMYENVYICSLLLSLNKKISCLSTK